MAITRMNVSEVYDRYQLMPQLREHHLRVAAVGKQICEHFAGSINTPVVVEALLVHDLGNILKFDLSYFPEFLEPQGLAYWEDVKRRTAKQYKTEDEHIATRKMAEEIGISQDAFDCVGGIGFSQVTARLEDPSYERKICSYADQRVSPYGVASIQERLAEGKKRYQNHRLEKGGKTFERLAADLAGLETQIFDKATIQPEDITNTTIKASLIALAEVSVGS